MNDAQRLKTLQKFLAKQKLERQHQADLQDQKALEDVLQARQMGR
jgi:hypothetical protein